jgi:N,N'-diacetyllegionaminate synthase
VSAARGGVDNFRSRVKTMAVAGFRIGTHDIGNAGRCFVVGEIAQAHDGSLGMAHAYIDAIAAAGADAVKFQTHIAEAESSPAEPWRVRFSPQDASRFDYWKRMEFREDQWLGLKEHADRKGLVFLSSPFSDVAVDLLERVGMPAWKIASGEINNQLLLERVAATGKPVLLSSGMSGFAEIERVTRWLQTQSVPVAVMQCSSSYPTPPEKVGLNLLGEYRSRFSCPVGLSDHSGTIFAGLAAATLGADLLEIHVTMSREMFGPDVIASVTTSELAQMVQGIRFIERAHAAPLDKDAVAPEYEGLRQIFTKSLHVVRDLPAGSRLQREHLIAKKPGNGIAADKVDTIVGRTLLNDVKKGAMLKLEDLS